MNVPPSIAEFWQRITSFVGTDRSAQLFDVFHFDDNEANANTLADLGVAYIKRATAGLVWSNEIVGVSPPCPGALSVVTY
jgi:uncharacterized protein YhfF